METEPASETLHFLKKLEDCVS